ncbi:hypothetical protein EB796_023110 [Bugula neritina]|uniref:Uncharacterized protein n=1 Tax=Bugula neritina TaxID=10212 RepID=A0A7J7IYD9_BUGNE|nr:hypothetical protein EB796_023110 [Bugula neritina]
MDAPVLELEEPDFFPSDVNPHINISKADTDVELGALSASMGSDKSVNKIEPKSEIKNESVDIKIEKHDIFEEKPKVEIKEEILQTSTADDVEDTESIRKEVFLPYQYKEWLPGCVKHPGNIVEPASLAVVDCASDLNSDLSQSLPPETVAQGKLSSLQLESIVKAAQRHQVILANGSRAGFFIGDAAGVGKGRQIAGVIMDNYCRGRDKHIWFSVSNDLIIDAQRDLRDIGCFINVIDGCKGIDKGTTLFGLSESIRSGVVFSTYSTLVSNVCTGATKSMKKSRLSQLISWCGGAEFNGCLVFDECHRAKNFVPGDESSSSKVALAVCEIQRALPKARVLYCSATGVTDVKNMAFMERMGLWGESSAFQTYEEFLDTIQKKGLGIAEMLAMDMKRDGLYVSRMLSFSDAQFYNIECNLTDGQKLMYNMAAHIWNEVRKALAVAAYRCRSTKSHNKMFWSQHQRFFQQMCISMKVDMIVKEAKAALEDNKCVVIGLQNTGEASLDNKLSKGGQINSFISTCREILLSFLKTHFPVEIEYKAQSGLAVALQAKKYDEWSIRARDILIGFANQLTLPDSALDALIDKLGGPTQVAEMTGRRGRIVRYSPAERPQHELRQATCVSDQSLNVSERDMFMSGKKLVAIISDAASTGISLHADKNCPNYRQRVHITLQLPWSADKAVQQLGRSHRSNQASGPIYKLVTTVLGGERRFAASVAKRLQSLGALTKGDRRAATGADLSMFNYDTVYGRTALKLMYQAICKGKLAGKISLKHVTGGLFTQEEFIFHMQSCIVTMGFVTEREMAQGIQVPESDSRDVGRFLNRILGLQVVFQNLIFNYFIACLDVVITSAKKEGKFNEGFVDLTGSSITQQDEPKSVFTALCDDCKQVKVLVDRGMSWSTALKRFHSLRGDDRLAGFYKTRNPMHNKYFYLLVTPHTHTHYKIARPNTGVNVQELDSEELQHKYQMVTLEKAEIEWKKMYEETLYKCNHGSHCNNPRYCQVGMRRYSVNIICGSLMRILPLLETTLLKHGLKLKLSKYDATVKVVRVRLDNGERLIGFQYPEILMPLAEKEATAVALENKTSLLSHFSQTIEPISPVLKKMYLRATTPPPTIKSYFTSLKPTSESSSTAKVKVASKSDVTQSVDLTVEEDHDIICVLDRTPVSKRKTQSSLNTFFKKRTKLS